MSAAHIEAGTEVTVTVTMGHAVMQVPGVAAVLLRAGRTRDCGSCGSGCGGGAALQTAGWRPERPPARLCSALHGDTSPAWLCSTQQISRSTGVTTDTALPRHTTRVSRSTFNTTRGHVSTRRSGYLQTSSSWCRS